MNKKLTPREIQVVKGIATGNGIKEIAYTLGKSAKTVEGYWAIIKAKLGVGNSIALTHFAIANKIIKLGDCQ